MRKQLTTLKRNASGKYQLRMIGGTYIKPTTSLGVKWAYRKRRVYDKEGKGGSGVGGKMGVRHKVYFDEMSEQFARPSRCSLPINQIHLSALKIFCFM
jgi:hypothetical protein